jgi:hypothetical protein
LQELKDSVGRSQIRQWPNSQWEQVPQILGMGRMIFIKGTGLRKKSRLSSTGLKKQTLQLAMP